MLHMIAAWIPAFAGMTKKVKRLRDITQTAWPVAIQMAYRVVGVAG